MRVATLRLLAFNAAQTLSNRQWEMCDVDGNCTVHVDSGLFAWLVLNRKKSSANVLTPEMVCSISKSLDVVEAFIANGKARIAIVVSGKSSFCAGADISQLYRVTDAAVGKGIASAWQQVVSRVSRAPFPIVAAINGAAMSGGCELALACHHRVISTEGRMGLPDCLIGLIPHGGATALLPAQIGMQNAIQWVVKGASVPSGACLQAGAVDCVLESSDRFEGENRYYEEVRRWTSHLLDAPQLPAMPRQRSFLERCFERSWLGRAIVTRQCWHFLNEQTQGKYVAQYAALEAIMHAHSRPAETLDFAATKFGELLVTAEAKHLMMLYLQDHDTKKVEARTGFALSAIPHTRNAPAATVIGAGVLGSGIHLHLVRNGIATVVEDVDASKAAECLSSTKNKLIGLVKQGKTSEREYYAAARLMRSSHPPAEAGSDRVTMVIDCAKEDLETKRDIVRTAEARGLLNNESIFATATSSLSVASIQSASRFPERVVGLHFLNPVSKMPLVEIVRGPKTAPEIVAMAYYWLLRMGKKPVVIRDAPGSFVHRVLCAGLGEALRLVTQDKADPNRVDQVLCSFGMPMGPLRLIDEIGLDVMRLVGPNLRQHHPSSGFFDFATTLRPLVTDGLLGRKVRKGLYRYDANGHARGMDVTATAKYLQPYPDTTFPVSTILDRCIYLEINEAAKGLEEGVVSSPEDVDKAMIWGAG